MGSCSIKLNEAQDDSDEDSVVIENGGIHPKLFFSSRYLLNFAKSSALNNRIKITMADLTPLLVEYQIGEFSDIKYYLAPKIQD